jgi:eukaryotic-like serine/threonine-protein kinase
MTSPAPERRLGTTVRDKWTIERILGVGGMAAVYVGLHRIGRRDALKILHPEAAKRKDVCKRFEREAKAVNSFRHPGAVEIRDIDVTEDGAPFLVMELLDGESLLDRVDRLRTIPVGDMLDYADQMLDVLAAAHSQGIIHRDIKPANLYLLRDGRLKVLDFGLARVFDPEGANDWTKTGATLGTTPYMPPEQARGHRIDARADLFAVGATMFRLLTGRRVHDAESDFELLMKMAKEPVPPLASVMPRVPRDVALVVDRALAFDREQRYPDAASMLEDVRAVRAGKRPRRALGFLELEGVIEGEADADGVASTQPSRVAEALTQDPEASLDIPVLLSDVPSNLSSPGAPLIDLDVPSMLMVSVRAGLVTLDAPPPPAPPPEPRETTLLSPTDEPAAALEADKEKGKRS